MDDLFSWQETEKIGVPWGELDVGNVIFTLPTEKLKTVISFSEKVNFYDQVIEGIRNFFSMKIIQPLRIVFDVEKNERDTDKSIYPFFVHNMYKNW